jgi:hypothetical protein
MTLSGVNKSKNLEDEQSRRSMRTEPSLKRRLGLEINTLQNAPSEADKLTRLLQLKNRQKDEAIHIGDTEGLVTQRLKC